MNQPLDKKLNRRRNFGDVITDSFTYVRTHYKSLGKSVLYFVIPIVLVASVFFGFYMQEMFSMMPDAGQNTAPPIPNIFSMMTSMSGTSIFGILAATSMSTVIFNHMSLVSDSEDSTTNVNAVWERFKSDFFGILGISIASGLLILLGTFAFIIPGIYLMVKYALIPAAYVKERLGIREAFSRSWYLTSNFWWNTFGLMIIMGLLVSFMSYFLSVPIMIISTFAQFAGGETGSIQSGFGIIYGTAIIFSYIFYALYFIAIGLQYFNLTERKEGPGMKQQIEGIQ